MFTVVLNTIAKQDTYFKEKQDILVAETVNGREKYRPASVSFTVVEFVKNSLQRNLDFFGLIPRR